MCPESMPTVSVVPRCPSNANEWVSAAKQKSCNELGQIQTCTNPDKFVYHCILNKQATQLLEVCAPTWFLTGKCKHLPYFMNSIINICNHMWKNVNIFIELIRYKQNFSEVEHWYYHRDIQICTIKCGLGFILQ